MLIYSCLSLSLVQKKRSTTPEVKLQKKKSHVKQLVVEAKANVASLQNIAKTTLLENPIAAHASHCSCSVSFSSASPRQ
jgi:hypothetical protein